MKRIDFNITGNVQSKYRTASVTIFIVDQVLTPRQLINLILIYAIRTIGNRFYFIFIKSSESIMRPTEQVRDHLRTLTCHWLKLIDC